MIEKCIDLIHLIKGGWRTCGTVTQSTIIDNSIINITLSATGNRLFCHNKVEISSGHQFEELVSVPMNQFEELVFVPMNQFEELVSVPMNQFEGLVSVPMK